MSSRPILIIHGWSDNAESFIHLAQLIADNTQRDVHTINLGNYVSLDDNVTMDDLVETLDRAWMRHGLSRAPSTIDVIVHSTGGLIIRDWMTRYFSSTNVPIKNLLMLAPANFGSPLAQKGRALIGRITVGLQSKKIFQTGAQILKALELASPYSWDLAMRDCFGADQFYGPGKILCTVLIGNQGFRGIRAAANEPGMDGTVRISTANLNCAYCEIDFTQSDQKPVYKFINSNATTAFGIMLGENHNSIVAKEGGPVNPETLQNICMALEVTDEGFLAWQNNLAHTNQFVMKQGELQTYQQGYQTVVCYLDDQYHRGVNDYFIEFYSDRAENDELSEFFHSEVIHSVHAYQEESSYRSLFINCTQLQKLLSRGYSEFHVSLAATPSIGNGQLVGYRNYDNHDFTELTLQKREIDLLFKENRTLFVKIKIKRIQSDKLFEINKFTQNSSLL